MKNCTVAVTCTHIIHSPVLLLPFIAKLITIQKFWGRLRVVALITNDETLRRLKTLQTETEKGFFFFFFLFFIYRWLYIVTCHILLSYISIHINWCYIAFSYRKANWRKCSSFKCQRQVQESCITKDGAICDKNWQISC